MQIKCIIKINFEEVAFMHILPPYFFDNRKQFQMLFYLVWRFCMIILLDQGGVAAHIISESLPGRVLEKTTSRGGEKIEQVVCSSFTKPTWLNP